jgi:hypothetical protein
MNSLRSFLINWEPGGYFLWGSARRSNPETKFEYVKARQRPETSAAQILLNISSKNNDLYTDGKTDHFLGERVNMWDKHFSYRRLQNGLKAASLRNEVIVNNNAN